MLTLNVAICGHTWPPAEASSCGDLSTLQPTGTIHVTSIARRRHCVGTCHHYVYHILIICRHVASLFKSLQVSSYLWCEVDPISPSQVFVAANSNAVLRLVHVDPLGTEILRASHLSFIHISAQDPSTYIKIGSPEVANGTVLQKLKAIVWLAAWFGPIWIAYERILASEILKFLYVLIVLRDMFILSS